MLRRDKSVFAKCYDATRNPQVQISRLGTSSITLLVVMRITQINMIENRNFLKFENWWKIGFFLCFSKGEVCFWSINECWLASCVVWVKGARKKREKRGQKITEICRNLQKCSKSFIYCHKFARNWPDLYFNILLRERI